MANERDFNPRSMAFIGLSAILHSGLVAMLMLHSDTQMPQKQAAKDNTAVELAEGAAAPAEKISDEPSAAPVIAEEPIAPTPEEVKAEPVKQVVVVPEPAKALPAKVKAKPKAKAVVQKLPEKKAPEPKILESAPVTDEDVANTETAPAEEWVPTNAPTTGSKDAAPENLSPVISDDGNADELAAQEASRATVEHVDATATESGTTSQPAIVEPTEGAGTGKGKQGTGSSTSGDSIVEATRRHPLPGNPLPSYPREDRLAGKEGQAVVVGKVETHGAISQVRLEKTSGSSAMDSSAVSAFKSWKFQPGEEVMVRKAFKFSLSGEAQDSAGGFKKQSRN